MRYRIRGLSSKVKYLLCSISILVTLDWSSLKAILGPSVEQTECIELMLCFSEIGGYTEARFSRDA